MINSVDFERKISGGKNKSRTNKGRIKTTSTNSNFNPNQLLDVVSKKQQSSLSRMSTKEQQYTQGNIQNISKSFQTLNVKSKKSRIQLSQRLLAKINSYLEQAKEMIIGKKFQDSIDILTKALRFDENH